MLKCTIGRNKVFVIFGIQIKFSNTANFISRYQSDPLAQGTVHSRGCAKRSSTTYCIVTSKNELGCEAIENLMIQVQATYLCASPASQLSGVSSRCRSGVPQERGAARRR